MVTLKESLKQIKTHVKLAAHSKGIFLKPIKNMDLRVLKASLGNQCNAISSAKNPTKKAVKDDLESGHATRAALEKIYHGAICSKPLNRDFVQQIMCLYYKDAMGVIALRVDPQNNAQMEVCGISLFNPFKMTDTKFKRRKGRSSTSILNCKRPDQDSKVLKSDLKNNKLCDIVLLCSSVHRASIGKLLFSYTLWDIKRRVSQKRPRYTGIHLTVAGLGTFNTATKWLDSVDQQGNTLFYKSFGFRRCCTNRDSIPVAHDFPEYRMVLHGKDWSHGALLSVIKNRLRLPSKLLAVCDQSSKCI